MDLLSIADLSKYEIEKILSLSKTKQKSITGKHVVALLFEKPSTRTRTSFESAATRIGWSSIYLDSLSLQMSRGESIEDTAKVLSMYVDMIVARLGSHKDIERVASSSTVPVINALTDLEHPCQALSDLYTINEAKGKLHGLKIAFVGDIATNTANSLMIGAVKMGAAMALVGPKSWKPNEKYFEMAKKYGSIEVYNNMKDGLEDADIVYTDTFVSMGKESEAARRRRIFTPYQINERTLDYADDKALVMHCLPAHRGEEITTEVLDGRRSLAWKQAANKLPVEEAILEYVWRSEN
ncbi:MAG: ornithine carbamoyltransferase [Candidatus Marsarchaeota archaeon]|nr:ornithine carbamoyltransferase [Candidatus Marsarchaeota archaeon]